MLTLEEQEGRSHTSLDAVWLGRGHALCRPVGREVIHIGGQAFIGRGWQPVMCAGSWRCSHGALRFWTPREAKVIECGYCCFVEKKITCWTWGLCVMGNSDHSAGL